METYLMNKNEETISLDCKGFFKEHTNDDKSPIDKFYAICSEYAKLTKPEIIEEYPDITRLLLMGYVSAVEEYLRNIFCSIINICPVAKNKVSDKVIKFGSIDYYDLTKIAEGLFDSNSFASGKEIRSKTKDLLNIDINKNSSLDSALNDFDKICHLRHCAIHSGGILNGHNAKELELNKEYVKTILKPGPVEIQDALLVCFSFVRAFNRYVFEKVLDRWKTEEINQITGKWLTEKEIFMELVNTFWSNTDNSQQPAYKHLFRSVMPIASPREIYPDETTHHSAIKSIFKSFRELQRPEDYMSQFYVLSSDELIAVMDKIVYYDLEEAQNILYLLTQNYPDNSTKLKIITYIFTERIEVQNLERTIIAMLDNLRDEENIYEATKILIENCRYEFQHVYGKLIKLTNPVFLDILISIYDSIEDKFHQDISKEELVDKLSAYCDNFKIIDYELTNYEFRICNEEIQAKVFIETTLEDSSDILPYVLDISVDKNFCFKLLEISVSQEV